MKKLWSVCLALCMAFTLAAPALAEAVPLAPAALEAAPAETAPPAAEAAPEAAEIGKEAGGEATASTEAELEKAIAAAAAPTTIRLTGSFQLTSEFIDINGKKEITLDLNGQTVSPAAKNPSPNAIFVVQGGASLTIVDSVGTGKLDGLNEGTLISVYGEGSVATLKGGTLCRADQNAAVAADGGTLVLDGAAIRDCQDAVAVNVMEGTFLMKGGAIDHIDIIDNINMGGSVMIAGGSMVMSGGTIQDCSGTAGGI